MVNKHSDSQKKESNNWFKNWIVLYTKRRF